MSRLKLAACVPFLCFLWHSAFAEHFPGKTWDRSSPEAQGVNPVRLEQAVDYLRQHSGTDKVDELVIVRNGRIIWEGENASNVHGVWSCTKSFVSTCLGLLIEDGRCTLDTLAHQYHSKLGSHYKDVQLRHFATMTSGYRAEADDNPSGSYTHGPSQTPFTPATPLFSPPGNQYAYWDSAMNEFAYVLTQIAEESLESLFERRIANKIEMNADQWRWGHFDVDGQTINGGAGNYSKDIQISALQMARLGLLFLNRGKWDGETVLDEAWIDEATRIQVSVDTPNKWPASSIPGPGVYGFNWWRNGIQEDGRLKWEGAPETTYAASGYNNNKLFVIPDWQTVVVRLGLDQSDHKIEDKEWGQFLKLVGESVIDPENKNWNVETPHGPQFEQTIDVTEGTWINLDVSPDGETIAFDFLGDLYTMPVSGADGTQNQFPTKLTHGIAWDMQPRFSPDGSKIAFTSDRTGANKKGGDNLWVIDLTSGDLAQITHEDYRLLNGPSWTPDGNYLVGRKHFTSRRSLGAGEMWLYHRSGVEGNAAGGIQLTQRPSDQKDVNEPIFSPDGRYLYYSQDATGGSTFEYNKDSNGEIYAIFQLDLEKGETLKLVSGPGGACRPTPSPDGKSLAFVRRIGSQTALHHYDLASGSVRVLYDQLERDMQEAWAIHGVYPSFAWTPDNQALIVWAKGKIRRIPVNGEPSSIIPFRIQDTRTLTRRVRFPIEAAPPTFEVKLLRWVQTSPDGKSVIFNALGYIYLKNLETGEIKRLTSQQDHFENYPSFSRDGKYVVYTTWNDDSLGAIHIASADGLEHRVITDRPGHYIEPTFSPDNQTVVFRKVGGGRIRSGLWSREPGLYSISANGGKMNYLTRSGFKPMFGRTSERVYFITQSGGKDADNTKLQSILLDGTEERSHYNSSWATDYALSPDGSQIAFIERFNVYTAPFLNAGKEINVGPNGKNLPITKVSENAGNWVHFSLNGNRLHWALGPTLYSLDLKSPKKAATASHEADVTPLPVEENHLGWQQAHDRPNGSFYLVGGHVHTMGEKGILKNAVIHIDGNRIASIGQVGQLTPPADARIIDVSGQWILPGFVDTHAHGSQGSNGIIPQHNWVDYARLAFGVTTIHDPSNQTETIFAASEMTKAGLLTAPRTYSTGTILYGATGSYRAEINSLEDARFHLHRMKAVGAFSVKSYNQPRRDQRQQVIAAARELEMQVVPEGGSTFMHNLTMVVDGHTGIEHTLPVQFIYDDVVNLWRGTGVGYTPTLSVAYGGLSGEYYWYQIDDLWRHERITSFIPPHILHPRARRRLKAPLEDFNHIKAATIAKALVDAGEIVQAGGHGQLNGLCTHWEMWSFVQGGMTPEEALRCGTLYGAQYLGLDTDLGSIEPNKLADILVFEPRAKPLENIRDSERIQLTIANGRVFEAKTMNEMGASNEKPQFFWQRSGYAIPALIPQATSCAGCQRPGLN